jgi:Carbohydrate esterase, sialic acid-specific acetylesterase
MKSYRVLICLLLIAISFLQCKSTKNMQSKKEFDVFILMGQSNMAGYGELLPEDTIPVKGIYMIPTISKEPYGWIPARHSLHNRLPSDRFGLGLPFAKEILRTHPGIEVGLIPVAWGGAGIDRLNKGTEVYEDAIKKAKFAREHGGVIKGVLWHQGESDTVDEGLSSAYEKKLHALINDLRNDLQIPNLPFIAGNLAEFYGTGKDHNAPQRVKQINQVKNVLRTLPSKVTNSGFAESTGCTSIDSHNVHFNRESYIILGNRYAAAYLKIETR